MKIAFADLWRPTGCIDRRTYALIGFIGFAIKHNLDRFIATAVFHRHWGLFNYLVPVSDVVSITNLPADEARFLLAMVAVALPFIWVGVALTMKRLRSAKLSPFLIILFFIPLLNLIFFLILCFVPDREFASHPQPALKIPPLTRRIPNSALGSAAVSLVFTVPMGIGFVVLGAKVLEGYGWGLFVAVPFVMGFAATLIYGLRQPRGLASSIGVACLSIALLGGAMLVLVFEGLACLLMAMPIALPLAALGGFCGYLVQRVRWYNRNAPAFLAILLFFVPGVQWTEHTIAAQPVNFVVRSSLEINAPPERVWKQVVAFTQIPPPTEWIFRAGIAYPIRAEMIGTGPGAERHCVFSTGAFVEPIEIWDEPHRLKFSVTSNPPPMQEWTPYSHIDPPHLHGFLVSNGGQFLLTALPNGHTQLEGTTWYHHGALACQVLAALV